MRLARTSLHQCEGCRRSRGLFLFDVSSETSVRFEQASYSHVRLRRVGERAWKIFEKQWPRVGRAEGMARSVTELPLDFYF